MATSQIVITQNGVSGTAGVSRTDLALSVPVYLTNGDNTDVSSWAWELLDQPYSSVATLTGAATSQASFTPDVAGSYFVRLTVNGYISQKRIARIKTANLLLEKPAAGETTEVDTVQGWAAALQRSLQLIDSASSGAYTTGFTDTALNAAISTAGSTQTTLNLAPGTWTFTGNVTVPSNITLKCQRGVSFVGSGGTRTLALSGAYLEAGPYALFGANILVTGSASNPFVYPQWWGCVGDSSPSVGGGTDDSDNLQKALTYCSTYANTLLLTSGFWSRNTKNVLIWGDCNVLGVDRDKCGIVADANIHVTVGNDYGDYWLCMGLSTLPANLSGSAPGIGVTWGGFLRGFSLILSPNSCDTRTFPDNHSQHVINLFNASGWVIDDIVIDMRPKGAIKVGTTIASNLSSAWCSPVKCEDGIISNTIQYGVAPGWLAEGASPSWPGGYAYVGHSNGDGGINMGGSGGCQRVTIKDNKIFGVGDDACTVIDSNDCIIEGNRCTSVHGRMGPAGGNNNLCRGNFHTRVIGVDGYWGNSQLYAAYVFGAASPASENVVMSDNYGYLPSGPTGAQTMLDTSGIYSGVISGNILESDCATASSVTGIKASFYQFAGWTDPASEEPPPYSGGEYMRHRRIAITDNICCGSTPGTIEEGGWTASDNPGPLIMANNTASAFRMFGDKAVFGLNVSTVNPTLTGAEFANVAGACVADKVKLASFTFEGIRPGQTISGTLTNGQHVVYLGESYMVLGANATLDASAGGTGTGAVRIQLRKSGSSFMPDVVIAGDSRGSVDGYGYSGRLFSSTDYLETYATASGTITGLFDGTIDVWGMKVRR